MEPASRNAPQVRDAEILLGEGRGHYYGFAPPCTLAEARRHKFNTTLKALVGNLLVVFLLTAYAAAKAATISAISGTASDVHKAMNLARAGDTVLIPAGTVNWTQGASWNVPANVTLKGASTSATGGGDQTVIIDNSPSGQPLLNFGSARMVSFA